MVADTGKYTTRQAYEALGLSRSTFARYVSDGLIQCSYRRNQKDRMGNPRKYFTGYHIKKLWRTL